MLPSAAPLTRKSITTNPAVVTCDVCGRTLLRGENSDVFLSGGSRRNVCELCTGRAVHEGWIREGLDDVVARNRDGRSRRRGSLLSRLRARRPDSDSVPREAALPHAPEPRYDDDAYYEPEPVDAPADPGRAPAPVEPRPDRYEREPEPVAVAAEVPDHTLYESRSVRGVPTNAELKVARAMELFNQSQQVRTVAGVARSLGAPIVSARPSRTEGSVVTIVVAWELSWYRFEVDLGNEAAGVRVAAQGSELSELETIDQTANAAADDHGRLHPAASLA
ncbi:MAG: hypothetical protein QOH30_803 [Baekduia sp.]|nr:hypothetical protein [Conexibacter sp.]MDX6714245.1 hypothetical protein [Baekduia sp.]